MYKKLLLPHQGRFIQAPFLFPEKRWFMLVAGYGAGKTSSNAYLTEQLLKMLQGKKDKEGHRPRIMLAGVTLSHLQKTTLAYILEDLENSNTTYFHDKKNNILRVGGVDVLITPLQNPETIMGYDVCAVVGDEIDDLGSISNADDITFNAVKAVNERCRQMVPGFRKPFLAFGSTSQGQKGLYRVYTQFKKAGTGFVLMRGRTADNKHLDPDYVADLYRIYNEQERRVYLEGEFLALAAGRVFGDFDWDRNYINDDLDRSVLPGENLYWAQDFNQGYHRGCVGVLRSGIIGYQGTIPVIGGIIYIIKRYEFPDIREAPKVVRHDFPHAKILWIPDTTAKEQISHFARELLRYEIHLLYRTKNPLVEDSAFLVNKLLYTRRLILSRMARDTAEALSLAQRDKNNMIPKGVGPSSPIHDCDSVRLLCYYLASNKQLLNDIRRVTIARHLEMYAEDTGVEEHKAGYVELSPYALVG